jgi:outer membrane protein assembly factor BamB
MGLAWFVLVVSMWIGSPIAAQTAEVSLEEPLGPMPLVPQDPPAEPQWTPEQIEAWIVRLGDDDYAQREQATRTLVAAGLTVLDPLRARLDDPDAERRRRVRRILATVLEQKHAADLERFAEGKGPGDSLPGWAWFKRVVGDDPKARELFVAMQREEAGLLAASGAGSEEADKALQFRYWQIIQSMRSVPGRVREEPSPATLAALTLVLTEPDLVLSEGMANSNYWASLWQRTSATNLLNDGEYREPVRKLLNVWLLQPGDLGQQTIKLRLALTHGLEGGLVVADQLIRDKDSAAATKIYAAEVLARLGGRAHAARLKPLLDDETVLATQRMSNIDYEIQVRDAALAWLVYATEQEMNDYGLDRAKSWFERLEKYPQQAFYYRSFGYHNDEARQKAFERWSTYVAEEPLPDAAELPNFGHVPLPKRQAGGDMGRKNEEMAKIQAQQLGNGRVMILGRVQAEEQKTEDEEDGVLQVDRLQTRRLSQAIDWLEEGLNGDAVRLLVMILTDDAEAALRDDLSIPLYRRLRTEAARVLSTLPEAARDAYELQYGQEAARELRLAIRSGQPEALDAVARRYPGLPAGVEAAYRAAVMTHDRGDDWRAVQMFQRLQQSGPLARAFEPALSLQLAHSLWRLGKADDAAATLRLAKIQAGGQPIRLGRERRTWFAADESPLDWLADWAGPSEPETLARWPMYRGDATRNGREPVEVPYLKPLASQPLNDRAVLRKAIKFAASTFEDERRTVLPTASPVILKDRMVIRTPLGIEAYSWPEGRLLWQSEEESDLAALLRLTDKQLAEVDTEMLEASLRARLWVDVLGSRVTSDGERIYAIEGQPFAVGPSYQRTGLTEDGRRTLAAGPTEATNRLAAYDAETGKLLWETGLVGDAYFLSVPLPLAGELAAVVRKGNDNLLLAIQAETGAIQSETPLSSRPTMPLSPQQRMQIAARSQYASPVQMNWAASPSFASGVLICPTAFNRFVAIDASDLSILWLYQHETPADVEAMSQGSFDGWIESSVVLSDGRALLCPLGSEYLLCLDQRTGRLLWRAPRQDGIAVAGVSSDGCVLVVGRHRIRGLNLADGSPKWTPWTYPPGARPSGQGCLSNESFLLPLSSGEIAVIDLASGEAVARTRSMNDAPLGNLVGLGNRIVSQSPTELAVFASLGERQEQLLANAKPDDPRWQVHRAEVALYRGEYGIALPALIAAAGKSADDRTLDLLAAAASEALLHDLPRYLEVVRKDVLPRLEGDQRQQNVTSALLVAARRAERFDEAVLALASLMAAKPDADKLVEASEGRLVQPNRMWQAELEDLRASASDERRAWLDDRISSWLDKTRSDDELAAALSTSGSHPKALQARLDWASRLLADKKWLPAELALHQVLSQADDSLRAEALVLLAETRRQAGQPLAAALAYRALLAEDADVRLRDGRAAREIVAKLPAAGPVRAILEGAGEWGEEPIWSKVDTHTNAFEQLYPLTLSSSADRWTPATSIRTDIRFQSIYFEGGNLREPRKVALPSDGSTRYFSSIGYSSRVARCGHLTVLWLGFQVVAFDALADEPKLLWSMPTTRPNPFEPQANVHVNNLLRQRLRAGQNPATLPNPVVATGDYVCFQQGDRLVAVDPLSGKTLWTRDGLAESSDILGDERALIVTPPAAGEAIVLDPLDGRRIDERAVANLGDRVAIQGTSIVEWTRNENGRRLRRTDLATGRTEWELAYPESTEMSVADSGEAAILLPDGKLTLLDLNSGEPLAQTDLPEVADRQDIVLLADRDRWILVVNQRDEDDTVRVTTTSTPWNIRVSGQMFGIARATGAIEWQLEARHQSLDLSQRRDVPILVLAARMYEQTQRDNGSTTLRLLGTRYQCVDTRRGVAVFDETFSEHNEMFTLSGSPEEGRIEIANRSKTIHLKLSADSPGDGWVRPDEPAAETPNEPMSETASDDD